MIRAIIHPTNNYEDLEKKLKTMKNKYSSDGEFEGWRIVALACSTYLVSKNYVNHAQSLLNTFDVNFELENCQMPRFDDMPNMETWLKNGPDKIEVSKYQELFLENRLKLAMEKSFRDKVGKIFTSLGTILQKLDVAESNPLRLDSRSMQAISDLSGKLANLKTYFKEPFLDQLLKRHASIVEIFEIRISAESKLSSIKDPLERKLTYYTSIKDALKNKAESGFEPGSVATSLNDRLSSNIKALTSAQTILRWTEEALTAIKAILRVDIKNLLEDKEGVLQEATNWKNQSATRQLGLEEIDSLERDMLDYVKGQLLTVIDLAGQICQKIEDNTDTEKESKIANFRQKEELIANRLQNILLALQGIKIEGSSLSSVEKASSNVEKILNDCEHLEKEKNEYVTFGEQIKDFHNCANSIKDICTKWERVTNLLRDQKTKSQSLIQMWNQSESLKTSFQQDMDKFTETFPDSFENVDVPARLIQIQEDAKSSIDVLRKMRHNFEMFFKCQKQLIHEMQTVPSFDTGSLKKELMNIQQRYAELASNQKEKLFHVNKLVSTWENVKKEMVLLEDLSTVQLQNPTCNLTKIIQEISNLSQHAEKVVESLETEVLPKVNLEIVFIEEALPKFKEKIQLLLKESANQQTIEDLIRNTQTIDKSLAAVQNQAKQPYTDFKSHINVLNSLKEMFDKIFSFKNGEKSSLFETFYNSFMEKCLDSTSEVMATLKSIEDIEVITESSKSDLSTSLQGEVEIIKSIIGQETLMLQSYVQLEQNNEKIQDKIKILMNTTEVIKRLEKLLPNVKNAKILEEIETIEQEILRNPKSIQFSWIKVVKTMIFKVKSVVKETIEKEENSVLGKTLTTIETDLTEIINSSSEIESIETDDYIKKYVKLSSLCWKLPRQSEYCNQDSQSFIIEKLNSIFVKIVQMMQQDLISLHEIIQNDWLKTWLHTSMEEMCLGEPFTDVTQVVQCLDQTLILLNSAKYATICLENHHKWTQQLSQVKTNLSFYSNRGASLLWTRSVPNAEKELNQLFDTVAARPLQPDDVVILSTVDEMNVSLEKDMNSCRNFLAQLRYFEEKSNELVVSTDDSIVIDVNQLTQFSEEIQSKYNSLEILAKETQLLAPMEHVKELLMKTQQVITEKRSSVETVRAIVERTTELKELGIDDEEFEIMARDLLQDLNDLNEDVKLTEQQNEQIQSCLDEVTSLLEEYEASELLNADMLEIAQLHEELTIWLKDVEDALQKSLDLKSSLGVDHVIWTRALNVEIGVEYRKIFVVVVFFMLL